MVDTVSAEDRRKELYEDSLKHNYPEDTAGIKLRYKDTALVLFKEGYGDPKSFLSFGTRRSSSVSQYGNTPVIVRRSRSSNGELFTVAEQWPTLGTRTSVSNYTLLEAGERDEEESDTEDELDVAVKNLGESQDLKEAVVSEGSVPDDDVLSDKSKQSTEDRGTRKNNAEGESKKEENEKEQTVEYESRKVFMHYDLPIQRPKPEKGENLAEETAEEKELIVKQENVPDEVPSERENAEQAELKDTAQENNLNDNSIKESAFEEEIQLPESGILQLPSAQEKKSGNITYEHIVVECHEEKVLRKDVVQPVRSPSPHQEIDEVDISHHSPYKNQYTELKIVEPTDIEPCSREIDRSTSLHQSLDDDDDDIEFVDAISPVSPKIDIRSERKNESAETEISSPKPSNSQGDAVCESIPSDIAEKEKNEKQVDDLNKSLDLVESTKFMELPVRSPTPPKKSPRKSPRSPKSKGVSKLRHSSVGLPIQTEPEVSIPKGSRSASPTAKTKEHGRIFTFSLKNEKSKSVSSLNSRKGKDKDRLPQKDSVPDSLSISTDESKDSQLEAIGKRVGVRSMVIDGTIKRNFIVIHPSDESDTIGLAPKADVSNGDSSQIRTSKALSSMKLQLSGLTTSKIDSVQKISLKKDIKEELTDTVTSSIALGPVPKKTRSNKSRSTERMHESTHSLSSQPGSNGQRGLKIVGLSSELSQVDCDSISTSLQGLNTNKDKVTSKLCSIM